MSFLGAQNSIALGVQGIIAIDTGTGTIAVVTDPYWPYVSMLLHGDSPQQFNQDTSTNVFPITANGAVQASTRTPFTGGPSSYGSGYFNGSTGYLTVPDNAAFTLGTNDFTIECWIYPTVAVNEYIAAQAGAAGSPAVTSFFLYMSSTGVPQFYVSIGGSFVNASSSIAVSLNAWAHIACVRNGATIRIYVNGVQGATLSVSTSSILDSSGSLAIGTLGDLLTNPFAGYISNFRLVNGTCLYPSGTTFTPPTTQLTAVTNTALLTLQTNVPQNNNQFLDGSTNNFTVTRNGNTTQGSFNPFVSTYPYAVATNGGSAYFDGTGDYLTVPDSTAFTLGTNDFTIECWVNFSSITTTIFAGQANTSAQGSFLLQVGGGAGITCTVYDTGFANTLTITSTLGTIVVGNWYHIAFVRNGNTLRQYINGVQQGTANATGFTLADSVSNFGVGCGGSYVSLPMNGYISNFRLVNGTCLYPGGTTFTPPTAPLTAVTNTALLLGMSNGAIYDNTMLNNLETVASAQISTSVFKYGTGALKFNGSSDRLSTPAKTAFALGSGDFTIECWVNSAFAGNGGVAGQRDDTGTAVLSSFYMLGIGTSLRCAIISGATAYEISVTMTANVWSHVAFVRDGATTRVYINGVQQGTAAVSTVVVNTSIYPVQLGTTGDTVFYYNGYIDDFRFTKGICRYPSGTTFTPPTAAFPNS